MKCLLVIPLEQVAEQIQAQAKDIVQLPLITLTSLIWDLHPCSCHPLAWELHLSPCPGLYSASAVCACSDLPACTSWVPSELCWIYKFLWGLLDEKISNYGIHSLLPVQVQWWDCTSFPRFPSQPALLCFSLTLVSILTCFLTRSFPSPWNWWVLSTVKQKKQIFP